MILSASLPARGVWIEIMHEAIMRAVWVSLPARGVWIEITTEKKERLLESVTPRKGSVD